MEHSKVWRVTVAYDDAAVNRKVKAHEEFNEDNGEKSVITKFY